MYLKTKLFLGILLVCLFAACSGKQEKPQDSAPVYEPIDPARTDIDPTELKAHIERIDEHHIGPTKRYTYHVIIFQQLNKALLEEIAMYMYEKVYTQSC
jgi:hypothetical protein